MDKGYIKMTRTPMMDSERDRIEIIGYTADLAEAQDWAEAYAPDYDASSRCLRLDRNNQESTTIGIVGEIIWRGDNNPYHDWDVLPEPVRSEVLACSSDDTEAEDAVLDNVLDRYCMMIINDGSDYLIVSAIA